MKKLLIGLGALALVGCDPAINPPPIPPPVVAVVKEIFHSTVPDPTGVHAPREPHSCAVIVEPADVSLHAPYSTVDSYWNANGWSFWVNCVQTARSMGRALPALKITGDGNDASMTPVMRFTLTTAPVFGRGSGHYDTFNAVNISVWRKGYVEASG